MFDHSIPLLTAFFAAFFVAGLVKGITGMGLPTVAMAMMGVLVSPLAAASLLIIPSFITNVWQLFAGRNFGTLLLRLWPMLVAVVAGTALGTTLITSGNTRLTTSFLGVALIVYATYALFARQISVPRRTERWLSPLIGAITGAVTGATGVFVIPAVPYLQALGLSKDDLVQALGLSFTVSTIALSLGLSARGALDANDLMLSFLSVLPALAGMLAGQSLRNKISPATFRRTFLICLLLLGCEMATRYLR